MTSLTASTLIQAILYGLVSQNISLSIMIGILGFDALAHYFVRVLCTEYFICFPSLAFCNCCIAGDKWLSVISAVELDLNNGLDKFQLFITNKKILFYIKNTFMLKRIFLYLSFEYYV